MESLGQKVAAVALAGWLAAAGSLAHAGPLARAQDDGAPAAVDADARAGASSRADDAAAAMPAARAGGLELSFADLDALLLARHAGAPEGRGALRELLERSVLEKVAAEERVEITPAQLNARWKELDQATREQGVDGGLPEYLEQNGVDPELFRSLLRLSLAQEVLARRGLGIPDGDPITPEQQTMWLEGVIEERGYEELPRPWKDVVARCGDATITRDDYAAMLRDRVSEDALRSAAHEILLERRILARMPDVAPDVIERAATEEIARRRADAEANPEYKGLAYEQLLGARGLTIESLQRDPAIRIAALARLWSERNLRDEDLRTAYESEREEFDARFGEGVAVAILHLNAAENKNPLVPRTFEEAEQELVALRARIGSSEDFLRLAKEKSEHVASKPKGGQLGVLTRRSTLLPSDVRDEVFRALDAKGGDATGTILGPLRLQGGCILVCLGARRPAPTWEEMSVEVGRELRRRFLDGCLTRAEVKLWRDE
jgi:hypothetical protein